MEIRHGAEMLSMWCDQSNRAKSIAAKENLCALKIVAIE